MYITQILLVNCVIAPPPPKKKKLVMVFDLMTVCNFYFEWIQNVLIFQNCHCQTFTWMTQCDFMWAEMPRFASQFFLTKLGWVSCTCCRQTLEMIFIFSIAVSISQRRGCVREYSNLYLTNLVGLKNITFHVFRMNLCWSSQICATCVDISQPCGNTRAAFS